MKRGLASLMTVFLAVVLLISACSGSSAVAPLTIGPITVGSKIDTEGALLSQVIIQMLEKNGFAVNDRSGTGTTEIVRKAIVSGEIDIYPEYTGNGAFFFNETTSEVWKDAEAGYQRVKQLDKEKNDIIWLIPSPANNTWAIAIHKTLAEKEKIQSLTDFAAYINSGGYVKLIGSEEFVTSEVALPAFQKAYGFTLKQSQLLTVQSGNTAQTEKAASEGTDGVNAAMAYGTDGALSAFGLVVLSDPLKVQPVYEPTPIIRGAVLGRYPQIETILAPVFKSLDLTTLQKLNGRIAYNGDSAAAVASDYLKIEGFIK